MSVLRSRAVGTVLHATAVGYIVGAVVGGWRGVAVTVAVILLWFALSAWFAARKRRHDG